MSMRGGEFELPRLIDQNLATLCSFYINSGKGNLAEIITNAQVHVEEGTSFDGIDGGVHGHTLHLILPEQLFVRSMSSKSELQEAIRNDINKAHNISAELISDVAIEAKAAADSNWRIRSGLLVANTRPVDAEAVKRIWGVEGFRVFLSHKTDVKKETAELGRHLQTFGMSCFVAHEDIAPTKAWQDEIENALASMDGLVALMTANFHDSHWTDQEVGFAIARGVPIIAVRLGMDPYGFIGRFQALSSTWENAPVNIAVLFMREPAMFAAYVGALRKCNRWDQCNTIAAALNGIETLSHSQINDLVSAYNDTTELQGSYAFNGKQPRNYGPGLVHQLNRLGSRRFTFSSTGLIEHG